MNMWNDTTTSNGSFDQSVKFFISSDSQLEMSGGDALDLQVFAGVTGQLEDLGGEVLKNSGGVNGRGSTDTAVSADSALQESVDTAHGDLHSHDQH